MTTNILTKWAFNKFAKLYQEWVFRLYTPALIRFSFSPDFQVDGAAEAMSSLSAAGEGAEPEEATVDSATSEQQQPKKASRAQKRRVSVFSSLGLFPVF